MLAFSAVVFGGGGGGDIDGVAGGEAAAEALGEHIHVGEAAGFVDCEVEVAVQVDHPLLRLRFGHFVGGQCTKARFAGFAVGVNSEKKLGLGGLASALALVVGKGDGSCRGNSWRLGGKDLGEF